MCSYVCILHHFGIRNFFFPRPQNHSHPRRIGLQQIFKISIGSSFNPYSVFQRIGIDEFKSSSVHFHKYMDWGIRKKLKFCWTARSHSYYDGPYGPPCIPHAALPRFEIFLNNFQNVAEKLLYRTKSQNVVQKNVKNRVTLYVLRKIKIFRSPSKCWWKLREILNFTVELALIKQMNWRIWKSLDALSSEFLSPLTCYKLSVTPCNCSSDSW